MNHEHHYNREDNNHPGGCYFHPKQVLVGVCPLCLNERLLILASKQAGGGHGHCHLPSSSTANSSLFHRNQGRRKQSFPKIFALGSYFFNRLELRKWKSEDSDHDCDSTSQDDSFISIKIEDNGVASWEKGKGTVSKVSLEHCNITTWNHSLRKEMPKSVIEHAKPRASLRWQKRIGHLFQLIRLNKSTKSNVCHVGSKVEEIKLRKGLTKRGTKG